MARFKDQVVFITGASSGIGAAIALEFAREGARVVLTARRADRLALVKAEIEALGGTALAIECDVTDRASLDRAVEATLANFGRINVVLANAGFTLLAATTDLETSDYRQVFDTNVFGVIDTVYATLSALKKSRGQVVIVSSIMGRVGWPGSAPYCASKFALVGLAESIFFDLADHGINVTCINPGAVNSEIREKNKFGDPTKKSLSSRMNLIMSADRAAKKMLAAIYKKKPEYTFTGHGIALVFLSRHFPRIIRALIRYYKKPAQKDKVLDTKKRVGF